MTRDERDELLTAYAEAESVANEAAKALHEAERRLGELFTPRYIAAKAWAQEERERSVPVAESDAGPLFAGART